MARTIKGKDGIILRVNGNNLPKIKDGKKFSIRLKIADQKPIKRLERFIGSD